MDPSFQFISKLIIVYKHYTNSTICLIFNTPGSSHVNRHYMCVVIKYIVKLGMQNGAHVLVVVDSSAYEDSTDEYTKVRNRTADVSVEAPVSKRASFAILACIFLVAGSVLYANYIYFPKLTE